MYICHKQQQPMSFLSDREIRDAVQRGLVQIRGFDPDKNLRASSYDVTLGFYYYRGGGGGGAEERRATYNPYRTDDGGSKNWDAEFQRAASVRDFVPSGLVLDEACGLNPETDRGILLGCGETIVAHTQEFFGALFPNATLVSGHGDMLSNAISVAPGGMWGDSGYVDRWPLLVTNLGRRDVLLVCGKKIATVTFSRGPSSELTEGNAPVDFDMDEVVRSWKPTKLLPTTGRQPAPTAATATKRAVVAPPDQRKAEVQQEIEVQQRQRTINSPKRKSLKLPEPERDEEGDPVLPTGLKSIDTKHDRGAYITPEVLEYDPLKI